MFDIFSPLTYGRNMAVLRQRTKILHVFDIFSPLGGGTASVIYIMAQAQAKRGDDVAIYTTDDKFDQDYASSLKGVRVYPFHCWTKWANFFLAPGVTAEAKRGLTSFDAIHFHCLRSFQNIVVSHYARKYGIPYIIDAHGSAARFVGKKDLMPAMKWLFDMAFGRKILLGAAKVIAANQSQAKEYVDLGAGESKVVFMPSLRDTDQFSRLPERGYFRQRFHIAEPHIILFLGRIHWVKGLDFLVRSFHDLTRRRSDVMLAIVGPDDGFKHSIDKIIKELNLTNKVLFTGFLGGQEKLAALVDADVLVQTSRYEADAWVSFEALACGTPVIVSKNTGAGEVIAQTDTGYLVEFGNTAELVGIICRVLEDPTDAIAKVKKARDFLEASSSSQLLEGYEKLYASCSEESKKKVRS